MMKEKKAVMRYNLVNILIVLFSAAVIIFFVAEFSPLYGAVIDKETCHSSVLLRSKGIGAIAKKVGVEFPLKCKTQYYCLSMNGECPENFEKISVENENDIKREIANAMYDCWWMLGEGKLDFLTGWEGKPTGVICSVITFDDIIKQKYAKIEGISEYLDKTTIPHKNITYYKYLTDNPNPMIVKEEGAIKDYDTADPVTVIFLITKPSIWKEAVKKAGIMAGTVGIWFGPKGIALAGVIGFVGGAIEELLDSEKMTALLLVPYTPNIITEFCQNLESIP